MEPKNLRFGGGASVTVLHPLVAIGMAIAIALIIYLPRRKAIVPFLWAFFTIPVAQVVVLAGVHFTMYQILILTVLVRSAFSSSKLERKFPGGLNGLDKVMLLWALSTFIVFYVEFLNTQALIKGVGDLVVNLGGYLAVRFLLSDRETVQRSVKTIAGICVLQGVCMLIEVSTGHDVFEFCGAFSSGLRDGHFRASGSMGSLYAGPFAAVALPLFTWLWAERSHWLAVAGIIGATAMVFASHASTSWMVYAGSIASLALWPLRKQMRLIRWTIAATLLGLHVVMKGPVWSLIEHIDVTGGSSSYHRYMLIDNCLRHFGDWWLIGTTHYGDWGFVMWDLCNQFVVAALTGGLVTLTLFIMLFVRGFSFLGRARRFANDRHQEWLFWCLASSLFGFVVTCFGINYMVYLTMWFSIILSYVSAAAIAPVNAVHTPAQTAEEHLLISAAVEGI